MKRNDFILIAIILVTAAAVLFGFNIIKKNGDKVVVKVNGKVVKELPLNQETTLKINGVNGGTNILIIKGGHAFITDASCPDKLCVKHKQIQYNGELIVCLPNRVTVEVKSKKKSEVDAVAN